MGYFCRLAAVESFTGKDACFKTLKVMFLKKICEMFQKTFLIDHLQHCTKMKFSIKDFFSKCDQIHRKLRIWSHLLVKSLMEKFIFCAVQSTASEETVDPSSHSNIYFSVEVDHETVIQTLVARIIV